MSLHSQVLDINNIKAIIGSVQSVEVIFKETDSKKGFTLDFKLIDFFIGF